MKITSKDGKAWADQRDDLPKMWTLYEKGSSKSVGVLLTANQETVRKVVEILAETAGDET